MVEPFCGMASMTLAGAQENGMADEYWLNDLNGDVAGVLHAAIDEPERLASEYENAWNEQFDWDGGHVEHYLHVRDEYNHGRANDGMFLYLVARVAKGSIRYSSKGMNQYVDTRRHGTKPDTMRRNIMGIHGLLHGRTRITSLDYRDVLAECGADDIVYMDPPYQGTSGRKDSRYIAGVSVDELENELHALDGRGIPYILSYDGACGDRKYGRDLDASLRCRRFLLDAGRSSQATLNGVNATTFEALYASDRLLEKPSGEGETRPEDNPPNHPACNEP